MEASQIDKANADAMTKRPFTLNMNDYINRPESKLVFNRQLFGHIASKYDFANRVLSFGRDKSWKNWLTAQFPEFQTPACLDIACGTGDITFRLAARYPQGRIVGIDITEQMLSLARSRWNSQGPSDPRLRHSRAGESRVTFTIGDMCRIDFPDNSFDVITAGYALRNAPDLEMALKEIFRVMKPGAMAAVLDFSKSPNRLFQKVEDLLLRFWGGFWGIILHGNPRLYTYIAASLRQFPDRAALRQLITQLGFKIIRSRKHFLGFTETIFFQKP